MNTLTVRKPLHSRDFGGRHKCWWAGSPGTSTQRPTLNNILETALVIILITARTYETYQLRQKNECAKHRHCKFGSKSKSTWQEMLSSTGSLGCRLTHLQVWAGGFQTYRTASKAFGEVLNTRVTIGLPDREPDGRDEGEKHSSDKKCKRKGRIDFHSVDLSVLAV